jgi:hypothetical protein
MPRTVPHRFLELFVAGWLGCYCLHDKAQAICQERHIWDLNMGSEEHMRSVFEGLKYCQVFKTKQERVKLGRWASWFNANRSWRGQRMPLLLILMYMGVRKGWFKNIADLPLFSNTHKDLDRQQLEAADAVVSSAASSSACPAASSAVARPTGSAAPEATHAASASGASASGAPAASSASAARPALAFDRRVSSPASSDDNPLPVDDDGARGAGRDVGPAPSTVKESNMELKKLRAQSLGTLHFVAKVLANQFGNQVCECIDHATAPSCSFFDMGKTRCKTVLGKRDWQIWLADNGYTRVMKETMGVCADPEAIRSIGFIPATAYEIVDNQVAEQDGNLAQLLLKLCMAECYTYLLSTMTWSFQNAQMLQ